ncbi:ComEA family DNA-binding protein [Methylobacterium oxalidis]|uniref:ComEA family DNA-binding protein n=1 Tax=Methylobacterium oxalidis TaxID=944322 RepID=UPI0033147411
MLAQATLIDQRSEFGGLGSKPVRMWTMTISALLGVGAVGLLATTAPKLAPAQLIPPSRIGTAVRVPLAVQVPVPSSMALAEAAVMAPPGPSPLAAARPAQAQAVAPPPQAGGARANSYAALRRLDLNTASVGDLRRLPRIGPTRARAIINGRPYGSVAALAQSKIVSADVFSAINSLVGVR